MLCICISDIICVSTILPFPLRLPPPPPTSPFALPPPQNLNKLAELVRGELPKLVRSIIGALITIDVHARDIVTSMVQKKVKNKYIRVCFDSFMQVNTYM